MFRLSWKWTLCPSITSCLIGTSEVICLTDPSGQWLCSNQPAVRPKRPCPRSLLPVKFFPPAKSLRGLVCWIGCCLIHGLLNKASKTFQMRSVEVLFLREWFLISPKLLFYWFIRSSKCLWEYPWFPREEPGQKIIRNAERAESSWLSLRDESISLLISFSTLP